MSPPGPASRIRTRLPARLSSPAMIAPLMPAPTITASYNVPDAVSCFVRPVTPVGKIKVTPSSSQPHPELGPDRRIPFEGRPRVAPGVVRHRVREEHERLVAKLEHAGHR